VTIADDIRDAFRSAIAEGLADRGIRQQSLGAFLRATGCKGDQATVSRMLSGNRIIRLDEGILLARLLDIDLAALVARLNVPRCATCSDRPPSGFICSTCGLQGAVKP
jgi:predicted transcriptional regulator